MISCSTVCILANIIHRCRVFHSRLFLIDQWFPFSMFIFSLTTHLAHIRARLREKLYIVAKVYFEINASSAAVQWWCGADRSCHIS